MTVNRAWLGAGASTSLSFQQWCRIYKTTTATATTMMHEDGTIEINGEEDW
jgi:hypothetical protein